MKNSLKTRPQLDIHYTPEENLDRMENWFEAFEKELREGLAFENRYHTRWETKLSKFIKEVLGE